MQRANGKNDLIAFMVKSAESEMRAEDGLDSDEWLSEKEGGSDALLKALYKKILNLRVAIDAQHQIKSRIISGNVSGKLWLRSVDSIDSRDSASTFNNRIITANNFLRIFYAYLLAAVVICRIYQLDNPDLVKSILNIRIIISEMFYTSVEMADDEKLLQILSEGKGYLINTIRTFSEKLDKKMLDGMLDQAKDWVALEEDSMPVVTVIKTNTSLDEKRIIIVDEPCTQLTQEQLAQFTDLQNRQWYAELSPFQQQLVSYYLPKILSGKCVIPSQLRAIVPLCKNSYKQTVYVLARNGDLTELNVYFHSGTPAYVSHKNQQTAIELTRLNLLQQKMNARSDVSVVVCLNSRHGDNILWTYERLVNGRQFIADDSEIIRLTDLAAKQLSNEKIYYSKLCLNGFRLIEYNDYSGINQLIAIIKDNAQYLDSRLPKVVRLLNLINRIIGYEWEFTTLDINVKGLDILCYLSMAVCLNNQLADEYADKPLKRLAVHFGCASGENRTGIAFYHNICLSLVNYFESEFNKSADDKLKKYIFDLIADSQHALVMTGNQGNTFGTEGIRDKSSGTLKRDHPKLRLVTRSSDVKSLPSYDGNFNRQVDLLKHQITLSEKNATLKSLLYYARQLAFEAEQQRGSIMFITDEARLAYGEILGGITAILRSPHTKDAHDAFAQCYQKITKTLMEYSLPLPKCLAALNGLLIKLIVEVNYLYKPASISTVKIQTFFRTENGNDDDDAGMEMQPLKPMESFQLDKLN